MNEFKQFDCHFEAQKVLDPEEGGPNIGKFEGFASTFGNSDRMDDIIVKGAFENTLKDHKDRSNRQIRMLFQHNRSNLIGGFPISDAREDDKGLFVKGDVNLDTQGGKESFSLMKQGVLTDMSIGFIIRDSEMNDGRQMIKDVDLLEISLVTEPANQEAVVTSVKSVMPFQDLPLADIGEAWDASDSLSAIKDFETDEKFYNSAFLIKRDGLSNIMQIATLVGDQLKAVPQAIFCAAASIQCGDHGLSKDELASVTPNIEKYYERMSRESPFEKGFSPDEIKGLSRGELVSFLRSSPPLSKNGAEFIASKIHGGSGDQATDTPADGLQHLKNTLNSIRKKD